jgi:CO/xanthine dehydrogenase Mo-binding subunit
VPLVLLQTPTPWVAADHPCYVAQSPIALHGGGFEPSAPLRITREGVVVATATAQPDGTFAVTLDSGPIATGVAESVTELTVSDPDSTVVQHVRVTTFGASYAPKAASPSAYVRFSAFGFGPGRAVYVHYLRPDGSSADTVRLGATRGVCGTIKRTAPRRLFAFKPRRGAWQLQFDTSRQLDPDATPRIVLPVTVS